jgi:hypothetical protein
VRGNAYWMLTSTAQRCLLGVLRRIEYNSHESMHQLDSLCMLSLRWVPLEPLEVLESRLLHSFLGRLCFIVARTFIPKRRWHENAARHR